MTFVFSRPIRCAFPLASTQMLSRVCDSTSFLFRFSQAKRFSAHVFLFGEHFGKAEHQLLALRFLRPFLVTNKSAAWLMVTCVKKRPINTYSHYTKYVRNPHTQSWLPVSFGLWKEEYLIRELLDSKTRSTRRTSFPQY